MPSDLYRLIESSSRTLAPTKPEMDALLATWRRLGSDQGARAEYLQALQAAMDTLARSADIADFLKVLRSASGDV